jgi:S-DNA-T family DNA segregation ATPase FtsK/SpoIIIE
LAKKRPEAKKSPARWRSILFFFFLFSSLAIAVSLISPPDGFMLITGEYLKYNLGFLAVFVPVVLFLTGSALLRLVFAGKWLRRTGAVFVLAFFLSAMLSQILCRIKPELLSFSGGLLSERVVLAVQDLTGGVIGWIGLFSLFMISLIAFTGWNISNDINSLLGRRKTKPSRSEGIPGQLDSEELEAPGIASDVPVAVNPWMQKVPEIIPAVKQTGVKEIKPVKLKEKVQPAEKPEENPVELYEERYSETYVPKNTVQQDELATQQTDDQYILPGVELLALPAAKDRQGQTAEEIEDRAVLLVSKLAAFEVDCKIAGYSAGPVLTRYEITPGTGVKVNRILNLADDLAMVLEAKSIRILAPIPGKGTVGIEVPNRKPETVYLREIISKITREKIPVALGKKLEGQPFIVDLTDMPHLLIAGATGSGKSVCVHAIISTILLTKTPYQVKLAMIDPKMLELSAYKGIPHLWAPVVVESKKARFLLEALVREMVERYALLARTGVRSISEYNSKFDPKQPEEQLPYIVVVIDELADLMMVSARDVEPAIARLAQMARAVGIHLVVATQRPSVDVITGVIKANFPSRIAFNVQSKTDSRTILDMNGADKLLGNGDMLFVPAASPESIRVHGSYVTTEETRALVDFWKVQPELPFEYEPPDGDDGNIYDPGELDFNDPLLEEVKKIVVAEQRASVSMIQRKFRVGYARAGKLIDMLERMRVVGPHLGSKPREVLLRPGHEEEENETVN